MILTKNLQQQQQQQHQHRLWEDKRLWKVQHQEPLCLALLDLLRLWGKKLLALLLWQLQSPESLIQQDWQTLGP